MIDLVPPNQRYHHGDLKSELIRKGLKILDEEGYEGFSLRKVAKTCNVSQTAPYRHFKDKDELIAAITMQAMEAFNQSLRQAVDKHPGNPKSQLREMGLAYIRFFAENPEYLRLLFLSNVQQKIRTDAFSRDNKGFCHAKGPCHAENHFQSGHPFATFFQAVERYKAARGNTLEQNELILYCWGLVHGISTLIVYQDIPCQEDYLSLVSKIIWSDKFLE